MFTLTRRRLATASAAVLLSAALAACTSAGGGAASGSALGNSLTVAVAADISSLDPIQPIVAQNREITLNVYDTLVGYATQKAADGTQVWTGSDIAPQLATSWTINGASATFTLRQGVKFHGTGNAFTADDVYWTYKRALENTKGFGAFNLNMAGLFGIDQLKVDDPTHITFTFKATKDGPPTMLPVGLPTLRYPMVGIIDSVEAQKHATAADPWADTWLGANAAGTGPYFVASHQPGQQIVLQTNPTYWGTAPTFSTVTLRVTGGADVSALIKSGEVQYAAAGVNNNGLNALAASGFTVLNEPVPNQLRLQLGVDTAPLDKPQVRQAIAYAVPYQQIIDTAFSGNKTRAQSWDNPKATDWTAAWQGYTTDVAKAKDLMSQAGVTNATLPLYFDSGISYNQDVAQLIQSALAPIGIKVDLRPQPSNQFLADLDARSQGKPSSQSGMSLYTDAWWLDNAGPSTNIWIKTGGQGNWTHYSNPQVDAIHAANYASAAPNRDANYQKLQQLVAADAPLVPLVVTGRSVVTAKGITGDLVTPDGLARYWSLTKTS